MHGASVGWASAHQQSAISQRWAKAHPKLGKPIEAVSISHQCKVPAGAGLPAIQPGSRHRGQARSYNLPLAVKCLDNPRRINNREDRQ